MESRGGPSAAIDLAQSKLASIAGFRSGLEPTSEPSAASVPVLGPDGLPRIVATTEKQYRTSQEYRRRVRLLASISCPYPSNEEIVERTRYDYETEPLRDPLWEAYLASFDREVAEIARAIDAAGANPGSVARSGTLGSLEVGGTLLFPDESERERVERLLVNASPSDRARGRDIFVERAASGLDAIRERAELEHTSYLRRALDVASDIARRHPLPEATDRVLSRNPLPPTDVSECPPQPTGVERAPPAGGVAGTFATSASAVSPSPPGRPGGERFRAQVISIPGRESTGAAEGGGEGVPGEPGAERPVGKKRGRSPELPRVAPRTAEVRLPGWTHGPSRAAGVERVGEEQGIRTEQRGVGPLAARITGEGEGGGGCGGVLRRGPVAYAGQGLPGEGRVAAPAFRPPHPPLPPESTFPSAKRPRVRRSTGRPSAVTRLDGTFDRAVITQFRTTRGEVARALGQESKREAEILEGIERGEGFALEPEAAEASAERTRAHIEDLAGMLERTGPSGDETPFNAWYWYIFKASAHPQDIKSGAHGPFPDEESAKRDYLAYLSSARYRARQGADVQDAALVDVGTYWVDERYAGGCCDSGDGDLAPSVVPATLGGFPVAGGTGAGGRGGLAGVGGGGKAGGGGGAGVIGKRTYIVAALPWVTEDVLSSPTFSEYLDITSKPRGADAVTSYVAKVAPFAVQAWTADISEALGAAVAPSASLIVWCGGGGAAESTAYAPPSVFGGRGVAGTEASVRPPCASVVVAIWRVDEHASSAEDVERVADALRRKMYVGYLVSHAIPAIRSALYPGAEVALVPSEREPGAYALYVRLRDAPDADPERAAHLSDAIATSRVAADAGVRIADRTLLLWRPGGDGGIEERSIPLG